MGGTSTASQNSALPVVQPDDMRVWEDSFNVMHISVRGEEFGDVRPRRVFPLSGKADYVSFLGEKNREVALLAHPQGLDKQSRDCLFAALGKGYDVSRILRVDGLKEEMGVSQWNVLTDRGYAVFEVAERHSNIRILPAGRYAITDVDGNRFEIEDIAALDIRSQRLVASET